MNIEAIRNLGRNSVERARTLVVQAPTYAVHLREILGHPEKRFNVIVGIIGIGTVIFAIKTLTEINNPELNKRLLIGTGISLVGGIVMGFVGSRLSRGKEATDLKPLVPGIVDNGTGEPVNQQVIVPGIVGSSQ